VFYNDKEQVTEGNKAACEFFVRKVAESETIVHVF
jgi:hypothetical protein